MIDLLRDINMKCDAFKSTPEDLVSLEVMCKNCESIIIAGYQRVVEQKS